MNKNVIGDVAGQLKTLEALIAKMPKGELICLGDPNDRGPDSKGVIEYLMNNGRTVDSNHAHMLVETWEQSTMPGAMPLFYQKDILFYNGGIATMSSYDIDWKNKINFELINENYSNNCKFDNKIQDVIPKSHIDFLKNCPMYIEDHSYIFSHAPVHQGLTLAKASKIGTGFFEMFDSHSEYSLLWNRYVPNRPNKYLNGKINVFGHNSSDSVKIYCTKYPEGWKVDQLKLDNYIKEFGTGNIWAICIDTSSAKILTGLHLPSMVIYQQEYLD